MNIRLLTIGIPTFNRAQSLAKILKEVAFQMEMIRNHKIELIISDNCSTDETEAIAREAIERNPGLCVRFTRQVENIGFDRNCHSIFEQASGTFVWLLADDDFLEHSAVRQICTYLEKSTAINFAFINYKIRVAEKLESSGCSCKSTTQVAAEEIFELTNFAFSFISSCIFERHSWMAAQPDRFFGKQWIHMFVARAILSKGQALVIAEPLVTMHGLSLMDSRLEKRSTNRGVDFYMTAHLKFIEYAHSLHAWGFNNNVCRLGIRLSWDKNLRQIIYFKATTDRYDPIELFHVLREMCNYFWRKPLFWLVHAPALLAPNCVIARLYFSLLSPYKKMKLMLNS